MCRFCDVTGRENEKIVELPYFHRSSDGNSGVRLVRVNLSEKLPNLWNIFCENINKDFHMSSFIYFCPRCGRQLMSFKDYEELKESYESW